MKPQQSILISISRKILFSDVVDIDDESITFPSELDAIRSAESIAAAKVPNANFIAYNNVPMSVAHYKGKVIITVPRRAPGIPSTLNYVDADLPEGSSPALRPYPNFEMNKLHVIRLYVV